MKETNCHLNVSQYLQEDSLQKLMPLTQNGVLYFHWANWFKTCNFLRRQIRRSGQQAKKVGHLKDELSRLKAQTVWIKNKDRTLTATLYDLYEAFLDNRIRITWFQLQQQTMVSTQNESGPYTVLTSMRWFDEKIFAQFIHRKILETQVACRSFRLGVDLKAECRFDGSTLKSCQINLHQLTRTGFLLKFDGTNNYNHLLGAKDIEVRLGIKPWLASTQWDLARTLNTIEETNHLDPNAQVTLRISGEVLLKYGNMTNAKYSNKNHFFLFVRYSDVEVLGETAGHFQQALSSLVDKVEMHFSDQMRNSKAA